MRKAVYAGSFDPPTNGHLWMIERGSKLFDELIVAVALNPRKGAATFLIEEREYMLRKLIKPYKNARADHFDIDLLVDYAQSVGARYLLRGLRSDEDYLYEYRMRHANANINPDIITIFLMPPKELEDISSSFVKEELIGRRRWEEVIKMYVPKPVYKKILEKYQNSKKGSFLK